MAKTNDIKRYLISGFLLLFGLGVGNLEKIFILCFLLLVLWKHIKSHNYTINRNSQLIPLFLWGLFFSTMFVLDSGDVIGNIVYYLVAPSIMFILGYDLLCLDKAESDFSLYVYLLSLGFFLHAVISVILSARSGVFQINAEHVKDIWSGRMISRTIMGMYMVPVVCFSIPVIFQVEGKRQILQKVVAAVVVVAAIATSIYVGNRALLLISAILTLISLVLAFKYTKKKIRLLAFVILFSILVVFLLVSNTLNLSNFIENSFLAKRSMNIISDGRFDAYKVVFQHFDNYLFGWMSSGDHIEGTSLKWAHNVWLDIFVFSGIVPLFLFLMYSFRVIRDTIAVLRNDFLKTNTKVTVAALVIGIFLNWGIEPVLQSNPYFLSACCMIFGMYARLKMYKGNGNNVI